MNAVVVASVITGGCTLLVAVLGVIPVVLRRERNIRAEESLQQKQTAIEQMLPQMQTTALALQAINAHLAVQAESFRAMREGLSEQMVIVVDTCKSIKSDPIATTRVKKKP